MSGLRASLIGLAALLALGCAAAEDLAVDTGARPDATGGPGELWDREVPEPDPGDATPHGIADDGTLTDGMASDTGPDPIDARPRDEPGPTPEACAPLAVCGRTCADLDGDPSNCGACGRTCRMPRAMAACLDGACAVGVCEAGWYDADGDPDNGCESETPACLDGEPCASACGTEGRTVCDGGAPACQPPAELCNALDDNCEGRCDEGLAGCLHPIHRANGNGHIFTDDFAQATTPPFRLEAQGFFHLYGEDFQGMRAVFLCQKPDGRFFLTNDTACEIGRAPLRTIGYWSPRPLCGSTPLYRMYSAEAGNHFYTISAPERDNAIGNLGYRDEGVVGHVWRVP